MSKERRRHPRVELVAQVEVASSNLVHLLHAKNASRGGLFLEANPDNYPQLRVGTELQLHVCELVEGAVGNEPEDTDDIQVQSIGRIIRIEPSGDARGGFAVEFVDLDEENQNRLDRLIGHGKPID